MIPYLGNFQGDQHLLTAEMVIAVFQQLNKMSVTLDPIYTHFFLFDVTADFW